LIAKLTTKYLKKLILIRKYTINSFANHYNWREYLSYTEYFDGKHRLDLLMSGRKEDKEAQNIYAQNLLNFDWNAFYFKYDGGQFIEDLREEWLENYDVVLVDSRTGITDAGGVCTIQLPDILVLVFTSNEQSLMGAKEVALNAQRARQELAYDRANLLLFPLPSNIDDRTEYEETNKWEDRFVKEIAHFYDDWLPKDVKPLQMLKRTKLPYVAYFSFGEKLPVLFEDTSDVGKLGYAYSAAAMLIEKNFIGVEKLVSYQSHFDTLYSIRLRNLDIRAIYSLSVFPSEQWSRDRLDVFFLPEGKHNLVIAVERAKNYALQQTINTSLQYTQIELYFEFSEPVFSAIKKACEHAKQLRVASNLKKCLQDKQSSIHRIIKNNGKDYLQQRFGPLFTMKNETNSSKGYDSLSIWNNIVEVPKKIEAPWKVIRTNDFSSVVGSQGILPRIADFGIMINSTGKTPEIPYKKPEERSLIDSLSEFPRILLWDLDEFRKGEALQCIKFHEEFGFPLFWIDREKLVEKRRIIGHYTLCALKDNSGEDRNTPEIEWNNDDGSKPYRNNDYDENRYRGQSLAYMWNDNIPRDSGLKATSSFLDEFFFLLGRADIMFAADVWAIVQQGDDAIQNLRNYLNLL